MTDQTQAKTSLPQLAMKEIPQPAPDAQTIVALQKKKGRIVGYQLSDGQILSKEEGIRLARQGGIRGVGIAQRKGTEYLKSIPDASESNNLNTLPTIYH